MYIKRDLEPIIVRSAAFFPVIAILGPRQSGKTTLAKNLFPHHRYLTLEDPDTRLAAQQDPRTFLIAHQNDHGLIIDEFQYAPDLLSYIQTIVDAEKKMAFFILTGSQNFLMNEAITQSLAGRVALHTLLALSFRELERAKKLPDQIEKALYQGSYPAIYNQGTPPELLYKNYIQTYIERDVRMLTTVGDLTTFQIFLGLCASRVGQLINLTSLANDCAISDTTAKRWLSILQASYIIGIVRPYHTNFGKRLVKTPKFYFYDSGLLCHLLKIRSPEDLALSPHRGGIFESAIIADIFKLHFNKDLTPAIYFWRDKTGSEVDCIIHRGAQLIPLEIKSGRTQNAHFFNEIDHFSALAGLEAGSGYLIYAGDKNQPKVDRRLLSWQETDRLAHLIS